MLKGSLQARIRPASSAGGANLYVVRNYELQTNSSGDLVDLGIRNLQLVRPENYLALIDFATHITAINLRACLRRSRSIEVNVPDNVATWGGKGTTIIPLVKAP